MRTTDVMSDLLVDKKKKDISLPVLKRDNIFKHKANILKREGKYTQGEVKVLRNNNSASEKQSLINAISKSTVDFLIDVELLFYVKMA